MRRATEIIAFLGLSAAVHAGVMAGLGDGLGGPQGQGDSGSDRVTLQAAPDSLAALADRWITPPDPVPTAPALPVPDRGEPPPGARADTALPRLSQSRPAAPMMPPPEVSPQRSDPAPALARPVLLPSSEAPALPRPPERETSTDRFDPAPRRSAAPQLAAPSGPATPTADATLPPPAGSTRLAAPTSPRPPLRPADLAPPVVEAPSPAAPSAARPSRVAAGTGNSGTQGIAPAPTAAPPTLSNAQRQGLMAQWGGQIMARIERARPRVQGTGQVTLALQVSRSGQLAGLTVARSSGDPALDQAALTAVRRAGRFPAAPDGLTEASYGFSLPIRFR